MQKVIYSLLIGAFLVSCSIGNKERKLTEVFSDDYQFTGVTISMDGRMFVNYPYWSDKYKYAVVEVKDGKKIPYPDEKWNSFSGLPIDYFISVQSVFADKNDNLWILDTGNPMLMGVIPGGAKLLKVDLKKNKILLKYFFNQQIITKNSYLNDIRIDEEKNKAYITDSGEGGIIVLDTESGKQRKVLGKHSSTMAEPGYVIKVNGKDCLGPDGKPFEVQSDGLALDSENKYLYFHALSGKTLYRVPTEALNDESLSDDVIIKKVEKVSETGAADGLASSDLGYIFATSLEDNSIKYLKPDGKVETLLKDARLQWSDSLAISPDKYLYVTDSKINQMPIFNSGKDERKPPYKIYKVNISDFCKKKFSFF